MPASISGIIFNDVNLSGVYAPGDPGIPNVYVSLRSPDGTCQTAQSNASGNYSFANLTQPGTYQIYETVSLPNACPPTTFTQPTGFITSTTQRQLALSITQAQINANTAFSSEYFGHNNTPVFGCTTTGLQVAGSPSTLYNINLITGVVTPRGPLTPSNGYNAIGYSVLDNFIYGASTGSIVRLNSDQTVSFLAPVPNLPVDNYNTGDVNLNGWLYLYNSGRTRFYVVDVNPNSATFLQLIDPATGLVQTSNFGVPIASTFFADWAFNPVDGQLYGAISNSNVVARINPVTGVITPLTTTGLPSGIVGYGASFFDSAGVFYVLNNSTGQVYRVTLTPSTATAVNFSTAIPASANDGARCVLAALDLLSLTKQVSATTAVFGDILTYTLTVTNLSSIAVTGIVLTDPVPSGTTFVAGSTTIGGAPSADSPATGINVGTLAAGASTVVTFKVKVGNTLPTPNPMPNTATVNYTNGAAMESNTVNTLVLAPNISVAKKVSKTAARLGEVLTYTMTVTNASTIPATGVVLTDLVPSGTTLVPGSVTVNGAPSADQPSTGITIGTLGANGSAAVTFQVQIANTLPNPNPIPNTATVTSANAPAATSNTVTTLVFEPSRGVLFI